MRVVLDSNVVVAAFAAHGLCESVFEVCLLQHDILISPRLLDEITRNLARKLKMDEKTVQGIKRLLVDNGTMLEPEKISGNLCRDADDLHILGLAKAGHADCIVTGDEDLLIIKHFGDCDILTPRQFWSLMTH
jgi:uncharacterized protein